MPGQVTTRQAQRRPWSFVVMGLILAVALFVGAQDSGGPATAAERADAIAREIRCPTCKGLSVAESAAPASVAVFEEIRRRVDLGESNGEVRAFLVGRYTKDVLLKPEASGIGGVVWALPVVGLILALAGLTVVFRRWGARSAEPVTDEDRELVRSALDSLGSPR